MATPRDPLKDKYISIFKKHRQNVLEAVDPERLANDLYSQDLIGFTLKDDIVTYKNGSRYTLASKLINEIDRQLELERSCGQDVRCIVLKFCKILQKMDSPVLSKLSTEIMEQAKEEPGVIVVSLYKSELSKALETIGNNSVFIENLIAEEIIASSGDLSITIICEEIIHSIEANPQKFLPLVSWLEKQTDECFKLSKELESEYHTYRPPDSLQRRLSHSFRLQSPIQPNKPDPLPSVPLSRAYENKFGTIISKYDTLISKIISLFEKASQSDDLKDSCNVKCIKKTLKRSTLYKSNHMEIDNCQTVEEVIEFTATKNTSVLKIFHLKWLVETFEIPGGKDEIEKYETCLHDFCSGLKAKLLENRILYQAVELKCERIQFLLNWDADETAIDQIEDLITQAFDDMSIFVHVIRMKKINSITVTCFAPESIIVLLVFKVQQKLHILIKEGLISLTIGYVTLLDHKSEYKTSKILVDELKQKREKIGLQIQDAETKLKSLEEEIKADRADSKEVKLLRNLLKDEQTSRNLLLIETNSLKLELQKMKTVPKKKTLIDKEIQTSEQIFEKEQDQQQGEEYERAGDDADEFKKEDEVGGEKLQALRQDNENLQNQIEKLETQLHDRNLEFEKMKASIETTRPDDLVEAGTDLAHVEELERDRDEWRMKCEVLEKKNQAMLMDLDRGRNFEFQNKSLNSEIKALNKAMEKRVPVLRFNFKDIHYPPVTIVMTDVGHFKKNKFQWFSPGFYSHPGGYKLCLKVCAAGHEEGEGSHVSAYVHVMAGDNDDKLGWPFRGEIEVQLLNRQADENHKTVVVTFDDSSLEKVCSRVFGGLLTDAGMAARSGEGAPKLILQSDLSHNRIAGTEYLRDDSLFFCVTRVQVDASTAVPQAISIPTTENILTFRVKGYSKLKSKNGKFPSEPFYTHKQGYKFVLVVHPNGEYAYRGKSVSVFAHLMRGDYDDSLKFPFRGAITVQVVNQREENNHVEFPIEFTETNDPKGQRGARVSRISLDNIIAGHSTDGWGYANFIQHDHLYYNKYRNTQYLTDNDEIVFRVTKVDVFSK